MKKKTNGVIVFIVWFMVTFFFCVGIILSLDNNVKGFIERKEENKELKELPLPEITGGERGKLGIDKNINELNIDYYLGREDSVYRDMRMLEDPANYEAIGGDSYLSGYIKGFEIIPLPYIIPVDGLPSEVGKTYTGLTLFSKDSSGNYIPNYEESLSIIEELFPKDKVIFLMCGGGGYAGMTKEFLVSLGWNKNKIYNTGGYWFYNGNNNIQLKHVVNGEVKYDFDNIPYHEIDFTKLTKIDRRVTLEDEYYNKTYDDYFDGELDLNRAREFETDTPEGQLEAENFTNDAIQKKSKIINDLLANKKSFILVVQNTEDACGGGEETIDSVARIYLNEKKVYNYSINLPIFKKTKLYDTVKYVPTVIVINKGQIAAYIDLNKDSFDKLDEVRDWINNYVNFKK